MLLTVALLYFLCRLFKIDNSQMTRRLTTFQNLEENTVDAIYVGSSAVDRYWIGAKAYEEYGMTVYPLSTDGMMCWLMDNMIVECYKTQTPKLIILDMRPFAASDNVSFALNDARVRRVTEELDLFSSNRLSAVKESLGYMSEMYPDDTNKWDVSYYLPFIKFHSKWSEDGFTLSQLTTPESKYLGFYVKDTKSIKKKKLSDPVYVDYELPLFDCEEKALNDLLDYLDTLDCEVLFIDNPHVVSEETAARLNTVMKTVSERGYKYLNLNADYETSHLNGIDFKTDFYNNGHVNYYGAEKYTEYLAEYLNENYNLPDRRNEEAVKKDWDGVYDFIKSKIESFEKAKEADK